MEINKEVVAKVCGKEIKKEDVVNFANMLGPQLTMQFQSKDGVKKLVEEMVNQAMLYNNAIDEKLDESEEYKAEMAKAKENILTNMAFKKALECEEATDEELKNYYNEFKDEFSEPESRSASHILVDSEDKAKDIKAKIDKGEDFASLAQVHSACPSKANGGDLGTFHRGQMVKEFDDKVFSMSLGEISEPVKTQFGYHIIKLNEINDAKARSFDEVKDEVRAHVMQIKQMNAFKAVIDSLKDKYKPEIFV